jgi:hypothetical protein
MLGFAVLAVRARGHERAALVLAALCPTVFLLTNRVFSPQFMLVLVAGWMFAAALVLETRLEQLLVGLLVLAACFANLFVYPYDPPYHVTSWRPLSGAMYVAALLATGLLARRTLALALTRTARSRPSRQCNPGPSRPMSGAIRRPRSRQYRRVCDAPCVLDWLAPRTRRTRQHYLKGH